MPINRGNLLYSSSPLVTLVCLAILGLLIQSCAILKPYNPPSSALQEQVQIPGFPGVRAWADEPSESLKQSAIESVDQEKAANQGKLEPVVFFLALSSGGQEGAFGAGILCGWTQFGKRPKFKTVTGISTGSLMAPFAFLGSDYDQTLRDAYTTVSDKDIYKAYNPLLILLSVINIRPLPSLAGSKPLQQLVAKLVDATVLAKIAQEHRKGRRLLVGTTQLDAQRLVIWDVGAIAASGHPQALELVRKILVASASLPGLFPPQYFEVEAGGKRYQEMHGDGGVMTEVMLYENAIKPFSLGGQRDRKLFIIRNEKVYPEWEKIKPQLKSIASRALTSLIKTHGTSDLYRLYTYAKRDELDYNLAFIPDSFTAKPTSQFDTAYMNALFEMGYHLSYRGYRWSKYPPDFDPRKYEQEPAFTMPEKVRLP